MKIDTLDLGTMIIQGARVGYHMNNPNVSMQTFEQWLASAQQLTKHLGRAHPIEQLAEWCDRAYEGEARIHPSELSPEDHASLIVTLRATQAFMLLDELAEPIEAIS